MPSARVSGRRARAIQPQGRVDFWNSATRKDKRRNVTSAVSYPHAAHLVTSTDRAVTTRNTGAAARDFGANTRTRRSPCTSAPARKPNEQARTHTDAVRSGAPKRWTTAITIVQRKFV